MQQTFGFQRRLWEATRSTLIRCPAVSRPLWKTYYQFFPRERAYQRGSGVDNSESVFSDIFNANEWKSVESRSGKGSALETTQNIRRKLPGLVKRLSVKTFLDAPCGDFNWIRLVEFPDGMTYIGADIVPDLIKSLNANYADERRRFIKLNLIEDQIPEADLWLCRDCLFHLPNEDISVILQKFRESKLKYLLATNYNFCRVNHNVDLGGFRYINLRRPPFNLPKPIMEIDDFDLLGPPHVLALWSREQVSAS